MNDFKILSYSDIYGSDKLEIFKKMTTKAALTDFAIETGAYITEDYIKNDFERENRAGYYYTDNLDSDGDVYIAGNEDSDYVEPITTRNTCGRITLPYDNLFQISMDELQMNEYGIPYLEYGMYPQKAAFKHDQKILEYMYKNDSLNKTGKVYTIDSVLINDENSDFKPNKLYEYEYEGKKYIRIKANPNVIDEYFELSNGERYIDGDYIWNEIQPVKWLVDKKNKVIVSEKLLFSGIQYRFLNQYINNYFSNELLQNDISNINNQDLIPYFNLILLENNYINLRNLCCLLADNKDILQILLTIRNFFDMFETIKEEQISLNNYDEIQSYTKNTSKKFYKEVESIFYNSKVLDSIYYIKNKKLIKQS